MAVDTSSDEFVITRVFDAPRELVWKAWTEPARLRHWWGPKGFKVHHCRVDLRPGGLFHYGMKAPDGSDMWGRFVYREIVAPEKLVFIVSFSDKDGGISRHPSSPGWPLEMLSTVLFEEQGGKTRITVKWSPHSASEAERKIFRDGKPSMQEGWSGTFEQFTDYLARQ
jgi:uncharacterized protein YndB with AHSA1/START domain